MAERPIGLVFLLMSRPN